MGKLKPCGTVAAARRHRRAGEKPCEKCARAEADYKTARQAARRSQLAEKVKVAEPLAPAGGELDPASELMAMYMLLGQHMQEAPPQSVAGIVKQRVALLEALVAPRSGEAKTGEAVDELASRRKARRAAP